MIIQFENTHINMDHVSYVSWYESRSGDSKAVCTHIHLHPQKEYSSFGPEDIYTSYDNIPDAMSAFTNAIKEGIS